jgi:ribosomal protein S18 acetylase RimI-like enzyme
MDFVIRAAQSPDLSDINRCDKAFTVAERLVPRLVGGALAYTFEAVAPYEKVYPPEQFDPAAWLADPACAIYLAYAGETLAGQAALSTHWNGYAYLDDLRVGAAFRRRGLGRRLVAQSAAWARSRRLPGIMLETQDINAPACRLYASFGFVLGGIDQYLYRAGPPPLDETALYW